MREKGVRLFRSGWLECLTYMPFPVFVVAWLVILSGLAANLVIQPIPPVRAVAMVACGLAVWFFFEYVMHRHLFHMAFRSAIGQRFVFIMHGNHHDYPRDPLRNLMPLIVSLPLAVVLETLFCLVMGYDWGRPFFLGFVAGYVLYDGMHFAMHQWRFSNALLRRIQIHHLRHHYHDHETNYAVTAIFIDRLFGTCARKHHGQADRSEVRRRA